MRGGRLLVPFATIFIILVSFNLSRIDLSQSYQRSMISKDLVFNPLNWPAHFGFRIPFPPPPPPPPSNTSQPEGQPTAQPAAHSANSSEEVFDENVLRSLILEGFEDRQSYYTPLSLHPNLDRKENFLIEADFETVERWNLRQRMLNGVIMIGVANNHHQNITRNFAENMKKIGYGSNYFIVCLDKALCEFLKQFDIPSGVLPEAWRGKGVDRLVSFDDPASQNITTESGLFYATITQAKAAISYQLLLQGYTVLMTDVDVVFVKTGVVEYLKEKLEEDPRRAMVASLEGDKPAFLHPHVNSGFYLIKGHPVILRFFEIVAANQISRRNEVDQIIFNEAMDVMGLKENGPRSYLVYYLDPLLFTNGLYYFFRHTQKKQGIEPYTVHVNYVGKKMEKERSMYRAGFWNLPKPEGMDDNSTPAKAEE